MATTTATFERIQQSCEFASDTALDRGIARHKAALNALFEKWADEVVSENHLCPSKTLEIEIEGVTCVLYYQKSDQYGTPEKFSVSKKQAPMTEQKAAEQRARFNALFNK